MVTIRKATVDDVEFIVSVLLSLVPASERGTGGWNIDEFSEGVGGDATEQVEGKVPDSTLYVIELSGERVGRLRVVRPGTLIEIAGIQLLPAFRGRGVGGTVISGILDEGKLAGLPVELDVSKQNPDAERLYARLGFQRCGQNEKDYRMRATPARS